MRILVITYRLPVDLCSGDKATIHHFLKHLAGRGHEVVLLSFIANESMRDQLEFVAPYCDRVELQLLPRWQSYLNCLRSVFTKTPFQVNYFRSPAMSARIRRLLSRERFDVVYAYHLRSGQYLDSVSGSARILDLKPVQTLNLERMKNFVSSFWLKRLYRAEYDRVARYEPNLVRTVDRCFVISDVDRQAIDPRAELNNVVLNPHGVDADHFAPDADCEEEPNSLIFSGKMNYDPNVDAVLYFCQEIYPAIIARVPSVKLYVVGTSPKPAVEALARDPSIVVTGYVDDFRPYLNRAQVAVDPLRIGAGLQNKVLEGMAMGLPMVVTSKANEGIRAVNGRDVLVADRPSDFADHVVNLLQEPDRRRSLGQSARQLILDEWTWEKHFEHLEQAMLQASQAKSQDQPHHQASQTAVSSTVAK